MVENNAVWQRYIQILTYKLTKYTNKDFMNNISKMNTSDKITYIINLKTDLDNAYVFRKDADIKGNSMISIMREIYSFLYEDNNVFSQKSYIKLLKELNDLEKYNGSNATFQKIEVEKLERAFVDKIKWQINQIIDLTKNPKIKSKIKSIFDAQYRILHIGAIAFILMITSVALYYNISENNNQPSIKYPTEEVTRKDQIREKLKQLIGIDRQKSQVGNVLANSANFLQLADTSAAWAIIKSLENMKIRSDVKVMYQDKFEAESSDTISNQSLERRKRFAKLCSLAANYTINEYPKYNSAIKSYPKNINITLVRNDSVNYGGLHIRNTGEIIINEYNLTLDNGANSLVLFCFIAHEVVHLLVEYNLKHGDIERVYYNKLEELKVKGIRPPTTDVDDYIALVLKNNRYTETEAHKFDYKIFHEFFKGVIFDRESKFEFEGKQIYPPSYMLEFTESYLKARGIDDLIAYLHHSNEERQKIIGEMNITIIQNLDHIMIIIPAIENRLAEINTDKYSDLKEKLYKMKEDMLKSNITHVNTK